MVCNTALPHIKMEVDKRYKQPATLLYLTIFLIMTFSYHLGKAAGNKIYMGLKFRILSIARNSELSGPRVHLVILPTRLLSHPMCSGFGPKHNPSW